MPRSCGSVQNYFRQVDFYPDLRRNQAVLEGMTLASARQGGAVRRAAAAEIPVVVHILYRAEADNLSDEQVATQIAVLNEDYAAANEDLKNVPPVFTDRVGNPGLRFALATVDPSGAATSGITRRKITTAAFGVDDRMKAESTGGTDPWDATRYLNIWVCRLSGGVLGYAQFPGGPPETDGVVDPHLGVRPRRQRGRAVRPRAHHDPRGRPLPQPLPHLGRGAGADVHGHRLRRGHPEPVGSELRQARGSRRRRATTCPTATCS